VGSTWRYVNKKGGLIALRNNREIPIVEYANLALETIPVSENTSNARD
jgi:hypothetical protein